MERKKQYSDNRYEAFGPVVGGSQFDPKMNVSRSETNYHIATGRSEEKQVVASKVVEVDSLAKINSAFNDLRGRISMVVDPQSDQACGFINTVYNSIRATGATYRQAVDNVVHDKTTIEKGDLHFETSSSEDYYDDLVSLGVSMFNNAWTVRKDTCECFKARYTTVGGMESNHVNTSATATVDQEVEVRVIGRHSPNRKDVSLADIHYKPDTYTEDYRKVMTNDNPGKDKLARGLSIDKKDTNDLEAGVILRVIRGISGSSRITRYVKLWSYYLFYYLHKKEGGDKMRLPSNFTYTTNNYDGAGMSTVCNRVATGNSTVIYTHAVDPNILRILCLSVINFPACELNTDKGSCWFGGYAIPSEVQDNGIVTLLGPGIEQDTGFDRIGIDMSYKNVYDAICTYARFTNSYDDACIGLTLAAMLYYSDNVPVFCLPKSQGLSDVLGAVIAKGSNRTLPPINLNPHLMYGCIVVTRQCIGLLKEVFAYTESNKGQNNNAVNALYANKHMRLQVYAAFREWYFSRAFGITYFIDPLCINDVKRARQVNSVEYIDVYWAYCRIKKCISNSFMSYLYNGHWETADRMSSLGQAEAKKLSGSYNLLGVIDDLHKPNPYKTRLNKREIQASRNYMRLNKSLMPGKIRTLPGEIHSILPEYDIPDLSDCFYIPTTPETGRRIEIEFVDDEECEDDGEIVIVSEDEDTSEDYSDMAYEVEHNDTPNTKNNSTQADSVSICLTQVEDDTPPAIINATPRRTCACHEAVEDADYGEDKRAMRRYLNKLTEAKIACGMKSCIQLDSEIVRMRKTLARLSAFKPRKMDMNNIPDYDRRRDYDEQFFRHASRSSDSTSMRSRKSTNLCDEVLSYLEDRRDLPFDGKCNSNGTQLPCRMWCTLTRNAAWSSEYQYRWERVIGTIINTKEMFARYLKLGMDQVDGAERTRQVYQSIYAGFRVIPACEEIFTLGEDINGGQVVSQRLEAFCKLSDITGIRFQIDGITLSRDMDMIVPTSGMLRPRIGEIAFMCKQLLTRRLIDIETNNIIQDWTKQFQ